MPEREMKFTVSTTIANAVAYPVRKLRSQASGSRIFVHPKYF